MLPSLYKALSLAQLVQPNQRLYLRDSYVFLAKKNQQQNRIESVF